MTVKRRRKRTIGKSRIHRKVDFRFEHWSKISRIIEILTFFISLLWAVEINAQASEIFRFALPLEPPKKSDRMPAAHDHSKLNTRESFNKMSADLHKPTSLLAEDQFQNGKNSDSAFSVKLQKSTESGLSTEFYPQSLRTTPYFLPTLIEIVRFKTP